MDEMNTQDTTNTAEIAVPQFAFNNYLNFGAIKGESQEDDHTNWIEILSWGK